MVGILNSKILIFQNCHYQSMNNIYSMYILDGIMMKQYLFYYLDLYCQDLSLNSQMPKMSILAKSSSRFLLLMKSISSPMIVAVFLLSSYCAVFTGKLKQYHGKYLITRFNMQSFERCQFDPQGGKNFRLVFLSCQCS